MEGQKREHRMRKMPVARALASGAGEGQRVAQAAGARKSLFLRSYWGWEGPPFPQSLRRSRAVPSQQSQRTVILSVFSPEAPGSHMAHRQ